MNYKSKYVADFFRTRGWTQVREGNLFLYFSPPQVLGLPSDYILELPKDDQKQGYSNFIDTNIFIIEEFYRDEMNVDDLRVFFSTDDSVFRFRIVDKDTKDGSIQFVRYIDSLEGIKKVLSQSVVFVSSQKPIFGNAKFEVESFLGRCRALQTQKGSFVTKLEVPNDDIYTAINRINTTEVNNKLFDVLEFLNEEIIMPPMFSEVNENYIADNIKYINVELIQSIRDLYYKTQINNAEYQLNSNIFHKKVLTERVQPRLKYLNKYIQDIKSILLNTTPLEAIGRVKKLASPAPLHSNRNEVILDVEIANNKETIKATLRSEEYLLAVEAHKNEWAVKIKGKARQTKTMYVIQELEEFYISEQ